MQKVIINPSFGGNSTGITSGNFIEKDFNLELANNLERSLNNLGITAYNIRKNDVNLTNTERLNRINNLINTNDEVILLTLEIVDNVDNESGSKIVYALKNDDILPRDIASELENIGLTVIKYYQYRDPNNTSNNFYELIQNPTTSLNLIVSLGNPNNSFDNNFLLNNINKIANSIASAIDIYFDNKNLYIVQRGDTLFSIANKFNITVNELKEANNLTSNALIVGNQLIIPSSNKENNNDNIEGLDEEDKMYINYTVKSGDSLYSIARKYNTSINIIKDVNNLESDNLSINQILKIPASSSSDITNYNNYTVKSGDSLYSIASKFNTTVANLINLNDLKSTNLSIGQVLKIPNVEGTNQEIEEYTSYTVQKGDTLYKIASNYNTTTDSIVNLNNLKSTTLQIGQKLKLK